jgi:hypothetical protein
LSQCRDSQLIQKFHPFCCLIGRVGPTQRLPPRTKKRPLSQEKSYLQNTAVTLRHPRPSPALSLSLIFPLSLPHPKRRVRPALDRFLYRCTALGRQTIEMVSWLARIDTRGRFLHCDVHVRAVLAPWPWGAPGLARRSWISPPCSGVGGGEGRCCS